MADASIGLRLRLSRDGAAGALALLIGVGGTG
jgi:hypothetical protein